MRYYLFIKYSKNTHWVYDRSLGSKGVSLNKFAGWPCYTYWLFQAEQDMELDIAPNGEKRKTTPPDLLTLSNMYFERNQVLR